MLNDRQKQYIKATFRQIHWTVILLLYTFINSTVVLGQKNLQLDNSNFDKQKWLTSSDYRYEIVKSEKFPGLENLTQKQIIRLLGQPNFKSKKVLTYCFDIAKEKMSVCEGSCLTINLSKKIPPNYRVTMIWVEH